jgi:hypothetical protein
MLSGAKTGDVRVWTPRRSWRTVRHSALGSAIGIEVIHDGRAVFVAAWGARELYRIPLRRDARQQTKTSVRVPMKPNNLRWTADGRLLRTGQDINEQEFLACQTRDRAG